MKFFHDLCHKASDPPAPSNSTFSMHFCAPFFLLQFNLKNMKRILHFHIKAQFGRQGVILNGFEQKEN